jgi:hypothetical protein
VAPVVNVGDGVPGAVVQGQERALVGFATFLDLDVALDGSGSDVRAWWHGERRGRVGRGGGRHVGGCVSGNICG